MTTTKERKHDWDLNQEINNQEITKGVEFAQVRGKLELLWRPITDTLVWVWLFQNGSGQNIPFAEITAKPSSPESVAKDYPWEIVIDAPKVTLETSARKIYKFLTESYPQASDLKITFYDSIRSFINRDQLASYTNNLVAKTA